MLKAGYFTIVSVILLYILFPRWKVFETIFFIVEKIFFMGGSKQRW
jgi:hypothetical protein